MSGAPGDDRKGAVPSYLVRGLVAGFTVVFLLLAAAGWAALRDSREIRRGTASMVAEQMRISRLLYEVQMEEDAIAELVHRVAHPPEPDDRADLIGQLAEAEVTVARLTEESETTPQAGLWKELKVRTAEFFGLVRAALLRESVPGEDEIQGVFRSHDRVVALIHGIITESSKHLEESEREIERQSVRLADDSALLLISCLVLSAVCAAATVGFVRHGLRRMAQQSEELNRVSWHMLQTQEEVARRFSHELHDELGQSLAAVRAGLTRRSTDDLESLRADCLHLVDESIANVRELSQLLRPVILDDFGLDAGLRWLTEKYAQRAHIELRYDSSGTGRYADETETHLYRIAQEALTNIARHSGATAVQVRLEEKAGWIELTVEDNGRGLPEGAGSSSASIGMIGMRARAEQSGGEFVIGRAAAGGVRLKARVPARHHLGVEGAVSGGAAI